MKFSKSILIFLFFSSLSGAFFYALNRTNGNVLKSLQFALYFLAIKIGLIGPNLPPKLDQDQSIQQPVSRVAYNPYVSFLDDYRPSGLYMTKIEQPVPQHYVSYHSESVIKELRAGSRATEAAWLLITIWMLQQQSVGFQPVRQAPPPPHIESARNLLFGKPKSDQLFCQQALLENKGQYCQLEQRHLQKQHNIFYYLKYMNNDYNKKKHHQLLTYSEDLRKQGKFIGKESRVF